MNAADRPLLWNRREVLQAAAASALSLGALGPLACGGARREGEPLIVGGLPVTCNLTLPVACVARAESNRSAGPGTPPFAYEYRKFSGWPEIKESLMAGRISAGYMLAPLVMDLADERSRSRSCRWGTGRAP